MKKTILITLSIVTTLTIIGLWAYLFMFGANNGNGGIFSNFNLFGEETPIETDLTNTVPVVDVTGSDTSAQNPLRRLTTRPVAGATFIESGIRYAERGTGYIYDISLETGEETVVTTVTIPRTVRAIFSNTGNRVALISENSGSVYTFVGTISKNDTGQGVIDGVELPENVSDVAFSETGDEIYYFSSKSNGGIGYVYNISSDIIRVLFSTPLSHIHVVWGETPFIYTTATAMLDGHVYKLIGEQPQTIIDKHRGLTAFRHNEYVILSGTTGSTRVTYAYTPEGDYVTLPVATLPQKCTHTDQTTTMYCAVPQSYPDGTYPDDWYKGVMSFSDTLWEIDTASGGSTLLRNLGIGTGLQIDVKEIESDENGQYLYLINKNDDSLWLFDTTI